MQDSGLDAFAKGYAAGTPQILKRVLVGDLETPVSAYLKLSAAHKAYTFLLESVEGGAVRGRYSVIGLQPDIIWRSTGDQAEINRNALHDPDTFTPLEGKPLATLRALLKESEIAFTEDMPPMAAGLFGCLGYDMVRQMERLGPPNPDALGVPDATLMRPTLMVVFDAVRDEIIVLTPVRPSPSISAKQAWETAQERLDTVVAALDAPLPQTAPPADHAAIVPPASNTSEADYLAMVAKAKDYSRAVAAF